MSQNDRPMFGTSDPEPNQNENTNLDNENIEIEKVEEVIEATITEEKEIKETEKVIEKAKESNKNIYSRMKAEYEEITEDDLEVEVTDKLPNKKEKVKKDRHFAKVNIKSNPITEYEDKEEYEKKLRNYGNEYIPISLFAYLPDLYDDILEGKLEPLSPDEQRNLVNKIRNCYNFAPKDEVYQSSIQNEEREFTQEVTLNDHALSLQRRNFRKDSNFKGERAVLMVRSLLGTGSIIAVPLWHSGFWITLSAPRDQELIDLEYNIWNSKIALGRNLDGAIFSNDQVYLLEHFWDLVESHIVSTSLHANIRNRIRDFVKVPDIQAIALALASLIYPNGYPFGRTVLTNDGSYRETQGIIDLSKLLWTDRRALSEKQISQMTRRHKAEITEDNLIDYSNSFARVIKDKYKLNDHGLSVTFKLPSVSENLESGEKWVQNCIDSVDLLVSDSEQDEKRHNLIVAKSKSTLLCQYLHYVKNFTYTNEEGDEFIYEDEESILAFCNDISQVDNERELFFKGITEFIDNSVVSLAGTPSITEEEDGIIPHFPHIVPLEALYTFFILTIKRVRDIQTRM